MSEEQVERVAKAIRYGQAVVTDEQAESIARAAIAEMGEQWRDISTAPRDGVQVDLWVHGAGISGGGYGREPDCWHSDGKWYRYDEQYGDPQNRSEVHNVTHWRPRPAAPVTP